ncbi:hypothetical protein LXA43DRAFT_895459 [Ganoderma leucocontextum]|nr:hypothetical protein LXA43DRAFT_895459 [Ganoderma leucocontextum]
MLRLERQILTLLFADPAVDSRNQVSGGLKDIDAERGTLDAKGFGKLAGGSFNDADAISSSRASSMSEWMTRPPLVRIVHFGRSFQARILTKYEDTYPRILDAVKRILKLCGLTLMIIFVVMIASWFMALSHWFTVVFGHFVLRLLVPESIDDTFAKMRIDNTMIFAAIGALIVNLPPFLIFLLSIPITFDRTVVEGSAAPANELIRRITPKNRYALVFLKYAPRLLAGPIGCAVFWVIVEWEGSESDPTPALRPLHAALAGVAGEVALSGLGYVKDWLKRKPVSGESSVKDTLPV